ncbi:MULTISPECIES: riboflavin synthase [Haloarcula]|uniref:Riboflavin synthase n=1 Tax=Haloarcula pellucida TaxID=1427151 RepID=A0A830GQU6_9EURY|nr:MULTISPECIES: riboflavin synthase [Halomicroarcula]MBX0350239.1 riboflavin synthase [Halomicroarcula pellucida]MDS0277659.1 riboflavin synthase [Halomicroarcula sp. S1AR25-4]GGO01080.1 riboflavin synthase [Halomicroarcula pellucida]
MYTGVVETTGTVRRIDRLDSGCRIEVATDTDGLEPEDSIGISGVCLTVEAVGDGWFRTFLSAETVDRTYLAALDSGTAVNVERPMAAADRFDGHLVKGTVDATTEVVAVTDLGEDWRFTVDIPDGYEQYLVEKGAVALDGASLTVCELSTETFSVAVVPTTYDVTTLSEKTVGDPLHFEADLLAKYAERQSVLTHGEV